MNRTITVQVIISGRLSFSELIPQISYTKNNWKNQLNEFLNLNTTYKQNNWDTNPRDLIVNVRVETEHKFDVVAKIEHTINVNNTNQFKQCDYYQREPYKMFVYRLHVIVGALKNAQVYLLPTRPFKKNTYASAHYKTN